MQPPIMMLWKRMWNPKWRPINSCANSKKCNEYISAEFVLLSPHFTMIWHQVHLNCHYFAISLPSQPFLGQHFDFTFFHIILGGCTLFLQLGDFGLDFTFYNCILRSWQITCLLLFVLFFIGSNLKSFDCIYISF